MKHKVAIEKTLPANLSSVDLASALKLKNLKVTTEDSTMINFVEGTYSKTTGVAQYISWEVIPPFNKLVDLHKGNSKGPSQWFTTIFGVVLLVLANHHSVCLNLAQNCLKEGSGWL
ncbi:hypothetical protein [Bacteroides sp.]|jgi:hypothetical protein|uniref:hypothetical protein n=1 Tax=Bacteroides sp. TaxID=29523 RepID=UPI002614C80D|nr:hypothetical protein [Bacteroides sp.]MDD3038065.1 hypothetical protein [Bacteroides sp.]